MKLGRRLIFFKTIFCLDKNKHLYLQENKIKREEKEGYYDIYNILQYCCNTREDFAKFPTKDSARSTCIVLYICLIQKSNGKKIKEV